MRAPQDIAVRLFRSNPNVSVFELTQRVQSDTSSNDAEYMTAVVRAYWKIRAERSQRAAGRSARLEAQNGRVLRQPISG